MRAAELQYRGYTPTVQVFVELKSPTVVSHATAGDTFPRTSKATQILSGGTKTQRGVSIITYNGSSREIESTIHAIQQVTRPATRHRP